jgi:hypothetical protein
MNKCKHLWTDESVDEQGNMTCAICGVSHYD